MFKVVLTNLYQTASVRHYMSEIWNKILIFNFYFSFVFLVLLNYSPSLQPFAP